MPLHPAFGGLTIKELTENFSGVADYYAHTLSLPLYPSMAPEAPGKIVGVLKEILC